MSGQKTCFPVLWGLPEGWSMVKKVCMLCGVVILLLLMQFMIVSTAYVQVSYQSDLLMYFFNQVRSIAWFQASMSKRLMAPWSHGFVRCLRLIPGGVFFPFHKKSYVMVCKNLTTVAGIPCACVRNCVILPTIIWITRHFASRVGHEQAQRLSLSFILSMTGVYGWPPSTLLLIHAPKIQVGWPSFAIQIPGGRGEVIWVNLSWVDYMCSVCCSANWDDFCFF